MTEYLLVGLVLGGIYAVAAVGLVTTYAASGVLDFSYGAVAYFVARVYYFLHVESHWSIGAAAAVSILLVGPAVGAVVWALLVRRLMQRPTVVKVVATIGVFVALPALATLIFGSQQISDAPGLAPRPVHVFHLAGVPVTLDQVIVLGLVVVILGAGAVVLRYTAVGLVVRASVDSRHMTSLVGINPALVTLGVWVFSTLLAGLIGVLVAPIIGLDPAQFTLLVVTAFTAVIAARLRSLPRAVAGALLLGVIEGVVERYLPSTGYLATAVVPSIPFGLMLVFLLAYLRSGGSREPEAHYLVAGAPRVPVVGPPSGPGAGGSPLSAAVGRARRLPGAVAATVALAALPLVLHGQWRTLVGEAMALGVVFLSYTLITGEASLISLCQISFAGVGGVVAAELASRHGLPFLAALVVGGLAAVPLGLLVGALSVRLGELYVALVTLAVGLLMDNMVFSLNVFSNYGSGIAVSRPAFATGDRGFDYLTLAVFAVVAMGLARLRRSTAGMALAAARSSDAATRTLGIGTVPVRVAAVGAAAFVAGVGGALFAAYGGSAAPTNYTTLAGLVWLSVVVAMGLRSSLAAALAGLTLAFVPALFVSYLPSSLSQLPPVLFGLGAIGVVQFPEGAVLHQAEQLRRLARGVLRGRPGAGGATVGTTPTGVAATAAAAPGVPAPAAEGGR